MLDFQCPGCGEKRHLRGQRDGEVVHITCQSCGHRWTHDPWACPKCGGRLDPVRKPLLQKARGTQQSIIGFSVAKECFQCDWTPPEEGHLSDT